MRRRLTKYPTKARVKRVGKRSNLRLGQAVSWFPSGWVLMRVPAVANRGGSRCCCSPAPPGLSLLPQLYSDNVRARRVVQRIAVGGAEKRQSAMSSLRASATIIVLRVPARRSAVRAWYHRASCREFQQQRSSSHSSLGTAPIAEAATASANFHGADVDTVAFVRGVPWVRGSLSRFPA
jgi:hypothetical protein